MSEISREKLFGKLHPVAYKAIEGATVFCKLRGNPYVELVHWLHQLLQTSQSDVQLLVKAFDLDEARLAQQVTETLDSLPRGATSVTDLSSHLDEAVERAWVFATLSFDAAQVRSGHVLIALVKTPNLRTALLNIAREFTKLSPDTVLGRFKEVGSTGAESTPTVQGGPAAPGEASGAIAPAALGKQEALARFSVDLTERAKQGDFDKIVGRDDETRQVIDVLMRRRQNNPILTGEAGVGKTAVVEGFALRVANGDVPPALEGVRVQALDIGLLQAGASMKGEFENRLRQVIDEVQASPTPIILFVDEAHTLMGAGGNQGTGDAANLLKPALARGTLRTIAATTWSEYKKYIEKDPALTRRFQVVAVDEPDEDKAVQMMRSVCQPLESHHEVIVLDEALSAAVGLSHRYIPARHLPDKSVSLLDTACARVALSQHSVPGALEDVQRRREALETELSIVRREAQMGIDDSERISKLEAQLESIRGEGESHQARWDEERDIFQGIQRARAAIRDLEAQEAPETAERERLQAELRELDGQLKALQGQSPMVHPLVDRQAVASVVEDWTGIPVGKMVGDEVEALLRLSTTLGERVVGQDHALTMISRRIQTSRAGLENPEKPVGVFLLAGPSGVGKTETALALADDLYGGEHHLITINMSEFQESHTVSTLKGAPPGYVGYGEGGVLTEAVRRRPYSVVLLDEIEKAHSDVHELFFQVFDKGFMEDGEGRHIDFSNTLILLTSNVGSDLIMRMCGGDDTPDPEAIQSALRPALLQVFPAALLGRMVTIPYYPLNDATLGRVADLQLDRIVRRLAQTREIELSFDAAVSDLIVRRCTEVESGGRMIDTIVTNSLLPKLSQEILSRMLGAEKVKRIEVAVDNNDFAYTFS